MIPEPAPSRPRIEKKAGVAGLAGADLMGEPFLVNDELALRLTEQNLTGRTNLAPPLQPGAVNPGGYTLCSQHISEAAYGRLRPALVETNAQRVAVAVDHQRIEARIGLPRP